MGDVEMLRESASKAIKEKPERLAYRHCFVCNPRQGYVKNCDLIINCPTCGKFYYKGVDITYYEEQKKEECKDDKNE